MGSFIDDVHTASSLENFIRETCRNQSNKTVSREDYESFCKEFVFEKLKGKRFGEAFCDRFNINSFVLSNLSDKTAKDHIETLGYIK